MIGEKITAGNIARFHLLMLLGKLRLYPLVVHNGELYPAAPHSTYYKDWYDGKRPNEHPLC